MEEKSRYVRAGLWDKGQSGQRSRGQGYSLKPLRAICSITIRSYPKYS